MDGQTEHNHRKASVLKINIFGVLYIFIQYEQPGGAAYFNIKLLIHTVSGILRDKTMDDKLI